MAMYTFPCGLVKRSPGPETRQMEHFGPFYRDLVNKQAAQGSPCNPHEPAHTQSLAGSQSGHPPSFSPVSLEVATSYTVSNAGKAR